MTQPRYPKEQTRWRDYIERLLQQHHVDIQRLWRRIPQTPFAAGGVPLTGDTTVEVDQGSGTLVGTVISGPPDNFGSPNSFGPYSGSPFSGTPQTGGTVNTGGTASGTVETGGTASGTVETGGTATGTPAGGSTGGTTTDGTTNTGGTTTAGTPNTGGTASGTIETGGSASGGTAATGTANESLVRSHPRTDNYTGEWYRSGPFPTHAQHLRNGAEPDDSATYIYRDAFGTPLGGEFYRASLDGLESIPVDVPLRLVIRSRSDLIEDAPLGGGVTGTNTGHATGFTGADDATMATRSKLTLTLINTTAEGSGTMLTGAESSIVQLDVPQSQNWQTHYYYLTQHDRARIVDYAKLGFVLDSSFIAPGGGPPPIGARVLVSWVELQAMYTTGHTGGTATGTPNTGGTASGTIETGGTPQTGGTTTAGTTNTGGTNTGGTILTGGTPNTGTGSPGFPVIRSTSQGNSGANQTSHAITMPAGFAAGDILLVAFGNDGTATTSITSGTGWNTIFSKASTVNRLTVYWKRADGSGDNLTIGTSASEGSAYAAYAIYGAHASTNVEGTGAAAVAVNPNPPSLNPTNWGTENTLWFAGWSWDNSTISTTAFPANYTQSQINERWNNSNGVGVAMAARMLNAASEDPGTGTISALASLVTMTIAVRPN